MRQAFIELWEAFNDIRFNDTNHRFESSDVKNYTSTTTFVKKFEAAKDWDEIAGKYAKKHGMEVEAVKDMWSKNSLAATTLGTEIHSVMELLWSKKNYIERRDLLEQHQPALTEFDKRRPICERIFDKLKETYVPVANELVVYDKDMKIAGIVDFLAWNKVKGCYSILDWKTSKEFRRSNPWQKMKSPLENYDDCNVVHYSLQLSIYKYIIEKHTSLKIDELRLIQITADPEICDCIDFSGRIEELYELSCK